VLTEVVHGGLLKQQRHESAGWLSTPALTEKDRRDLAFGVEHGVDYVALSFVRQARDVEETKELIKALGGSMPVIAKIEKREAIEDLPRILGAADGVMVARGDLGVELSTEEVPTLQKRIIEMANGAGKVVITATQMLESMIESPRPTRAEASDVANAILTERTPSCSRRRRLVAFRGVGRACRASQATPRSIRPSPTRVVGRRPRWWRAACPGGRHRGRGADCKLIVAFTGRGATAPRPRTVRARARRHYLQQTSYAALPLVGPSAPCCLPSRRPPTR
jgi:hypothetical protein